MSLQSAYDYSRLLIQLRNGILCLIPKVYATALENGMHVIVIVNKLKIEALQFLLRKW